LENTQNLLECKNEFNGLRYKTSRTSYLVATTQFLQRGSVLAYKERISDETEILITLR